MLSLIKKNPQLLVIITLLGVILFQMFMMPNTYKKAFQQQLKQQRVESETRIKKLEDHSDSLETVNVKLRAQTDSILVELDKEEKRRKRVKNEYDKKMAELGKLSTDELPGYFSKRYSS
jgi:predicted Holliday junction resolvase-like endonuclease